MRPRPILDVHARLRRARCRASGLALATGLLATGAAAQAPDTDIYLIERDPHTGLLGGAAVNLTERSGYDNQPHFTPDGEALLYTSVREDGQADTWRLELASGRAWPVTRTPESEYSPTPLPGGGGFSAVRVEADSTQRLWAFGEAGGSARLLLPEVAPVGYHAWADAETVVLFVLGEPPTLQVASLPTGEARPVAERVGRSLQPVPERRAVTFVLKDSETEWWLARLDLDELAVTRLLTTPEGSEDHAWAPDREVLMAGGSVVYAWRPGESGWREVAELADYGLSEITRLAVSPDGRWVALVASRRTP